MTLLDDRLRAKAEEEKARIRKLTDHTRRLLAIGDPVSSSTLATRLSLSANEASRILRSLEEDREAIRTPEGWIASPTLKVPPRPTIPPTPISPAPRRGMTPPSDPPPVSPPRCENAPDRPSVTIPESTPLRSLRPGGKTHSTEKRRKSSKPSPHEVSTPVAKRTRQPQPKLADLIKSRKERIVSPKPEGSSPSGETIPSESPSTPPRSHKPTTPYDDRAWRQQQRDFQSITEALDSGWKTRAQILKLTRIHNKDLDSRLRIMRENQWVTMIRRGAWGPGAYRFVLPDVCKGGS